MITKKILLEVLEKYPELVKSGLVLKGKEIILHGEEVDLLFEDEYNKKKFAVLIRIAPITMEHLAVAISYQNNVLRDEAPDVYLMLIADKIPQHLQKTLDHNNVAWKEISLFQVKEHLKNRNDAELLSRFGE